MDKNEEYQDPDYHESSAGCNKPVQELSDEEKLEKIRKIIRREFANETDIREKEVTLIDERLSTARRILHKLRYALVNNFYKQERLQLSSGHIQDDLEAMSAVQARPELASIVRDGQRRIHPSVKKLLGKETVDLEEIFKSREPRNKARKDYQAMVKSRNITTPADATKSLRPVTHQEEKAEMQPPEEPAKQLESSKPKKMPRQINPKILNVFTIDEVTRNKMKHRYRIIIGNTSKYAPAASRADRSTHKWLLYIRGPARRPDVSRVLAAATVRLHHSYAPHHTVHLHKPPFHVSRRGWGEFPAKIELHFALPSRNRPATVEHTIKLDRNYTGLQTLGAETIVDVWLYSTPEMLEYEFTEPSNEDGTQADTLDSQTNTPKDTQTNIHPERLLDIVKQEPHTEPDKQIPLHIVKEEFEETDNFNETYDNTDSWMDFFSKNTTEVNVDEMLVKAETNKTATDCENKLSHSVVTPNNKSDFRIPPTVKTEVEESQNDDNHVNRESIDKNILKVPIDIVNQPSLEKKRIVKYIEPTTGKIYYLEMDRNLDLSKVQEILIESEGGVKSAKISPMKSNGLRNVRKPRKLESLLRPELRELGEKPNAQNVMRQSINHIENDHCYFKTREIEETEDYQQEVENLNDVDMELRPDTEDGMDILKNIRDAVFKLTNVRMVVDYMLKKIPVISADGSLLKCFPFMVANEERYWKLDFAKRRNIEWSRAKLINKMLIDRFGSQEGVWRTKQILIYSRLHGYHPIRTENVHRHRQARTEEWSSWNDLENSRKCETKIKEIYPNASDITTLTVFDSGQFLPFANSDHIDLTDGDDEIDIVGTSCEVKPVLPEVTDLSSLQVLPVESEEDRLRFLYIEKKCADIGIELRNEDVGNGCSYSAVHAVILSAVKSFAEELIRSALANKLSQRRDLEYLPSVWVGWSSRSALSVEHVYGGTRSARLHALTARALAARRRDTTAPL